MVSRGDRSRYFAFTRIRPSKKDYERLITNSGRIEAFMSYRTIYAVPTSSTKKRRKEPVIVGYFILGRNQGSAGSLAHWFPNFLIHAVKKNDDIEGFKPDFVLGTHPLRELKRELFKDGEYKKT